MSRTYPQPNCRISPDLDERLRSICQSEGIKMTALVRAALSREIMRRELIRQTAEKVRKKKSA